MSTLRYANFCSDDAPACNKLISYYEGDQEPYVKDMLDGKLNGYGKRDNWQAKGIIPRFRNFIKSVVDKSGMVFNVPPTLETWVNGQLIPNDTLSQLLYDADWLPFWQNVDNTVRLVKTVVVYLQRYIPQDTITSDGVYTYNPDAGEALMFMLTHEGNSCVTMDPTNRFITELAYLIDLDPSFGYDADDRDATGSAPKAYCVVTPMVIEHWVYYDGKDDLISSQVNPEGFVSAFLVHDTNKPRSESFNEPGNDLGSFQELLNLHLTDTEFAIAWQKQKTLVTTGKFVDSDIPLTRVPAAQPGHNDPAAVYDQVQQFQNSGQQGQGGLGSVIQLTTDDHGNAPMFDFKGPDTDLKSLDEVVRQMAQDIAFDWDVNLRFEGRGGASSGFQLIVEEMNNLNLRQKRVQFFQAAFRTMYEMLKKLYPELPSGTLLIKFAPPSLPVNEKEREQIWEARIQGNRGSVIDYLMETQNLTEEEATKKAQVIKDQNEKFVNQSKINSNLKDTINSSVDGDQQK